MREPTILTWKASVTLAALLLASGLFAMRASAGKAAPSLSELIKAAGFDALPGSGGWLRSTVTLKGETTLLLVRETQLGEGKDDDFKLAALSCQILEVPKDFKHPSAMLKKIAQLNDRLIVGRVGIDEQSGNVWYNSSFWLRTADDKILSNEFVLAHMQRMDAKKDLTPFLTE